MPEQKRTLSYFALNVEVFIKMIIRLNIQRPSGKGVFNQLSQPSNFLPCAAENFLGMTKWGLEARTR